MPHGRETGFPRSSAPSLPGTQGVCVDSMQREGVAAQGEPGEPGSAVSSSSPLTSGPAIPCPLCPLVSHHPGMLDPLERLGPEWPGLWSGSVPVSPQRSRQDGYEYRCFLWWEADLERVVSRA